jgi:hypothetical protein
MGRLRSQNGKGRSAFKILTGAPTGKKSLRRPRLRLADNIKIDLKEIGIDLFCRPAWAVGRWSSNDLNSVSYCWPFVKMLTSSTGLVGSLNVSSVIQPGLLTVRFEMFELT